MIKKLSCVTDKIRNDTTKQFLALSVQKTILSTLSPNGTKKIKPEKTPIYMDCMLTRMAFFSLTKSTFMGFHRTYSTI